MALFQSSEEISQVPDDVLQETKSSTFKELFKHSQQSHLLDEYMRDDHITDLVRITVNGSNA